ncbi:S8 family serine peptidase [Streptococcus jiangjianxini]|uniref:S8 family serine peptidase n=1 Tax=Streptococcus jiangjianxini TaxID=3161189 RepID=UPI0032EEEE32
MRKTIAKKQLAAVALITTSTLMMYTQQIEAQEETPLTTSTETPVNTEIDNDHAPSTVNTHETVPESYSSAPETSAQTPETTLDSELDSTNVTKIWEESQQGAGTVTAVLDSELNSDHEVFSNTDLKTPKVAKEDDLNRLKNEANIDYGKWISSKIIFAHNYLKNNDDLAGTDTHGSHVSGIAVGESTQPMDNGLKMTGVAPQSQLIFMKVIGGADELRAKAIIDAIHLGADSVNMSYGKGADSKNHLHPDMVKAIQLAKDKGVFLIASAGNDRAFGDISKKPLATNPDFGVVAAPGLSEDVISVAAYQNPYRYSEYLTTSTHQKIALSTSQGLLTEFDKTRQYQFVDAKFGRKEDFKGIDVKDKIVLIQRGEIDFADKITNAITNGAAGILIYNDTPGENLTLPLPKKLAKIPSGFISQKDGQALLNNTNQRLSFTKQYQIFKNPGGNQIAGFSSWGLTADGHLKPDVAAPGGFTLSAAFKGSKDYELINGTSAAAPHVAGLVNLLKPIYQKRFPNKTPKELAILIKQIMMSSATAIFNDQEKAYVSPRQQGAGLVDAKKAASATAYVTDQNNKSKIHLGDVTNTFHLVAKIHNLSSSPTKFYYTAHVGTDKVENQHFALAPRHLLSTELKTVTVPANTTLDISIPINVTPFHNQLSKLMPNGYFLEGFVRFMTSPNHSEVMSIPFIGFRGTGKFADLNAVEKSIYETPSKTFYYERPNHLQDGEFEVNDFKEFNSQNFTALLSQYGSWGYLQESKRPDFIEEEALEFRSTTVLGTYDKTGAQNIKKLVFKDGKPYLALSPNGDGIMDTVAFRGTLLRNVKDLKAKVYRQSDLTNAIWESPESSTADKHYSESLEKTGPATTFEKTKWDGKDQYGHYVGDGHYIYRIVFTPISEGAKEQHMDFELTLKTTPPALPSSASYDHTSRLVRVVSTQPSKTKASIFRTRLAYTDMEEGFPVIRYIEPHQDGTFSIPKTFLNESEETTELTPEHLTYVAEDFAGNYSHVKLTEILNKENHLPDVPKKDEPKIGESEKDNTEKDEPKIEESETEKPKKDEPKIGESEKDNTKKDEPKIEESETETPEIESPQIDKPEIDNTEKEGPEIDNTEKDEPKIEESETDNTEKDEPKIEESETDNTEKDEPKIEEPETDNTEKDEPKIKEPETDNTEKDEPKIGEPETDNTEKDEPKIGEPETDNTEKDEPKIEESETETPKKESLEKDSPDKNIPKAEDNPKILSAGVNKTFKRAPLVSPENPLTSDKDQQGKGTESKTYHQTPKLPQTGDSTKHTTLLGLLSLSFCFILNLVSHRQKKEQ